MARYKVTIKKSAAKELQHIVRKPLRQIIRRIKSLGGDKELSKSRKFSAKGFYRIRQGRWRIVYTIYEDESEVNIFKVGQRSDIGKT